MMYHYAAMDSSGKRLKLRINSVSATFYVTELAGSCPGEGEILRLEPMSSSLIFASRSVHLLNKISNLSECWVLFVHEVSLKFTELQGT